MGIDRIGGLGAIPGYGVPRVADMDAEKVKREVLPSQPEDLTSESAAVREESAPLSQRGKDAQLKDISLTFNKKESFDYLGQDSDIRSLDIRKAISDMQKDQIIQQYNFFVGSAKNLMENNPDGTVIAKW